MEKVNNLIQDKNFIKTIEKFEYNFTITLKQLITSLHLIYTTEANHQMANLILRLDFNDFYKQYFEQNIFIKK